jgi:hypothetical protein
VLWASVPARDPARPGPACSRAPLAPLHPPCAPPPPLSHLVSHAATPSPFLPPLSHLLALGDPVDGYHKILDPKVSSLSLPFPYAASPRARPPWSPSRAAPWPRCAAPVCGPLARGPARGRAAPRGAVLRRGPTRSQHGPGRPPARPARSRARTPSARGD